MNHYGIDGDVVIRLVGALIFGAAVGLERELSGHGAGLRTHVAVSLGAALFGVVSTLGFSEFQNIATNTYRADVTRVASQVVVGVGFLGGGMILHRNGGIDTLTTAASIWMVAAIGLAAGVGDLGTAGVGAALTLGYLVAFLPLRRLLERGAKENALVAVTLVPGTDPEDIVARTAARCEVQVDLVQVEKRDGRPIAVIRLTGRPAEAVTAATARLAGLSEVSDLATR